MVIEYWNPLSRGWERMKEALFRPFDLAKWFVVGFTAFLAGLMDWPYGGGDGDRGGLKGRADIDDILDFPREAWYWLTDHPGWFGLIIFGVVFLILLGVLLTWLSSRGKFMFLDNVVHDRAKVTQPWHEFRTEGDSLFLWRLVYGFLCFIVFMSFFVFCYFVAVGLYESYASGASIVFSIIGLALGAFVLFILTGYISMFLNDFIVPIQYKQRVSAGKAWGFFLPLLRRHFLHFILYGLFIFIVHIVIVIIVITIGIFTCCIGILLLIIPYINSVVLLPISYTLRSFSVEFLGQFGPDYMCFPPPEKPTKPKPKSKPA